MICGSVCGPHLNTCGSGLGIISSSVTKMQNKMWQVSVFSPAVFNTPSLFLLAPLRAVSGPSTSCDPDDTSSFDDGLRRRNVPSFEAPRSRTSDEEEEEEEEFKLAEKKEEKPWFSLNKCIVGALILLFLGSLFLSGEFLPRPTKPAGVFYMFRQS